MNENFLSIEDVFSSEYWGGHSIADDCPIEKFTRQDMMNRILPSVNKQEVQMGLIDIRVGEITLFLCHCNLSA